jgi:hypothetical protein
MDKEAKHKNTRRIKFDLKGTLYAKKLEDQTEKELEQLNVIYDIHVCNTCNQVVNSAKTLRRHMKTNEHTT